ncbi:MSMEG_1061 family FMN-dependent PPOX-type flavoprotein [uncultured Algibacter sp.]|uniref:MSMEG_1061 family FMN-dependent PPOX-type flavoprotein n=1 Tax=uncultured Algibacter sp. TaxID=298659 RepID=UPI002618DCFA|nr:MSMEG_1061 family FMN-dependent PPOX-type flavoprotein [uncultured Algibacter sp.]
MKISNIEQLRNLYDLPIGRAKTKVQSKLEKHSINFIKSSPFIVVSTFNKSGYLDTSPRGGKTGFVEITNNTEIIIPDAKGNNRLDSISNIIDTGRIGLLFMIPGINETLRINGSAHLSVNQKHLDLFKSENNKPKSCIVVSIEEVFLHCAKAFMRSKLWEPSFYMDQDLFPTMGQMLKDQLGSEEPPETREAMEERYKSDL